jgi:hypothetical protein
VSSPPPIIPVSDGKLTFWIDDSPSEVVAEIENAAEFEPLGL